MRQRLLAAFALGLLSVSLLGAAGVPLVQPLISRNGGSVAVGSAGGVTLTPKAGQGVTVAGSLALAGPGPWVDARAYGASDADATDDTSALIAALAATPTGGTLRLPAVTASGYYKLTSTVTVSRAVTIEGIGKPEVRQVTGGQGGFLVTASNVTFRGLTLTGTQSTNTVPAETAISFTGASAASSLSGCTVDNVTLSGWGYYGVLLTWVAGSGNIPGFAITGCQIKNVYQGGIQGLSARDGVVTGCTVGPITGAGSVYGISASRVENDSEALYPRSARWLISGNTVTDNAAWVGIGTHGGELIRILDNTILRCNAGIDVVAADGSTNNHPLFAPLGCTVSGNHVDSGVTDGSAQHGISFAGAQSLDGLGALVQGTSVEYATGSIRNNEVIGHGTQSNSQIGAIYVRNTRGLLIEGNTIREPSPTGIALYHDNLDVQVVGNKVEAPWTTGGAVAPAIWSRSGYNTGTITGNTGTLGTKSATFVLNNGIRIEDQAGAAISQLVGNDMAQSATPLSDAGLLSSFAVNAKKFGAYGVTPIVRPASGTDLLAALVTLGLLQSGSTPLDLGAGDVRCGDVDCQQTLTVAGGAAVDRLNRAAVAWNPPSLGPGASAGVDVAMGFTIALGDIIMVTHPAMAGNDLIISAQPKNTTTVRVTLFNPSTSATVDIANGTMTVADMSF